VHHAYAKHAEVTVPSLDEWERGWSEKLKPETLKVEMPRRDNVVLMPKQVAA